MLGLLTELCFCHISTKLIQYMICIKIDIKYHPCTIKCMDNTQTCPVAYSWVSATDLGWPYMTHTPFQCALKDAPTCSHSNESISSIIPKLWAKYCQYISLLSAVTCVIKISAALTSRSCNAAMVRVMCTVSLETILE